MKKTKYIVVSVFLAFFIFVGNTGVNALNSADFEGISSADPSGDVTGLLGDHANYTSIDILEASVSYNSDRNQVEAKIKLSGPIPVSDKNYSYIMNLRDSSGNVVSLYFSAYQLSVGAEELSRDHFSIAMSELYMYIPFSYFENLTDISSVDVGAYYYTEDDTYSDTLFMHPDSGSGSGSGPSTSGIPDITDLGDVVVTGHEPGTESPSDSSVKVSVTYTHLEIKDLGDKMEFNYVIKGTSSGASEIWVSSSMYYNDSGWNWGGYWMKGPFKAQDNTDMNGAHFFKFYLKGQSSETDLSTWEFRMHYQKPKDKQLDFSATKMKTYARAVSSAGGWNQAYLETKAVISEDGKSIYAGSDVEDSSSGSGSSIPGFELALFVSAIALAGIAYRRKTI